jgi:WXG100 family type VII secretion target
MADEIRADYDKLGQVASRFDKQAQQINEMIRKVKADFQKLEQGGWIGRGADAFFQEMRGTVLPASQRLESALKTGSQVTKEIIQHVRSAEEEASSPFKQTS